MLVDLHFTLELAASIPCFVSLFCLPTWQLDGLRCHPGVSVARHCQWCCTSCAVGERWGQQRSASLSQRLLLGHTAPITALALGGNGGLLASAAGGKGVVGQAPPALLLWDLPSGTRIGSVSGVTFKITVCLSDTKCYYRVKNRLGTLLSPTAGWHTPMWPILVQISTLLTNLDPDHIRFLVGRN